MNDLISAAYSERLRRVCDHIERHLDEPLSIEALSRMAHSSPFHFHRQFYHLERASALSLYPVAAFASGVMAAGV
ncbi:Transcriptional regulator, AraC [Salmonella enterica subsp. enterica]|nr:Transcriptional regulator, AraC [Salmonella enterica subsp. enterica]